MRRPEASSCRGSDRPGESGSGDWWCSTKSSVAADLFPLLRVLAYRQPLPARFLIVGSASPELLKESSETLAGRLETVSLEGFRLASGPRIRARRWTCCSSRTVDASVSSASGSTPPCSDPPCASPWPTFASTNYTSCIPAPSATPWRRTSKSYRWRNGCKRREQEIVVRRRRKVDDGSGPAFGVVNVRGDDQALDVRRRGTPARRSAGPADGREFGAIVALAILEAPEIGGSPRA